jgi:hypothetical protein
MKIVVDLFFQFLRNLALLCFFEQTIVLEDEFVLYTLKREIKVPSNWALKRVVATTEQIYYFVEKKAERFKQDGKEDLVFVENDGPCIVKLYWAENSWNLRSVKLSSDWTDRLVG